VSLLEFRRGHQRSFSVCLAVLVKAHLGQVMSLSPLVGRDLYVLADAERRLERYFSHIFVV
jgi:hypothetical protein